MGPEFIIQVKLYAYHSPFSHVVLFSSNHFICQRQKSKLRVSLIDPNQRQLTAPVTRLSDLDLNFQHLHADMKNFICFDWITYSVWPTNSSMCSVKYQHELTSCLIGLMILYRSKHLKYTTTVQIINNRSSRKLTNIASRITF